jgi:hypothetical protein
MNFKSRIICVLALLLSLSLTIDSRPRLKVIETGQFHGDEINARSGETWLGLFVNKHRSMLRYAKVNVRRVFDEVGDENGQKTGKKVSVSGQLKPILLIRPATTLNAGPVTTLFHTKEIDFNHGLEKFPAIFKLAHRSYVLKVVGDAKNPEPCASSSFPKNAKLVLISGHSQQVLYRLGDCGNDPSWYLMWAGDLDHDGKLDFYVNVTQHYDLSERKLFLSSEAKRGKLVREVGSFGTGGC